MTEELKVLKVVTGRLEGAGIRYMMTGSMAASYYAVPRMTRDIDLIVELSSTSADRFCDLMATSTSTGTPCVTRSPGGACST